MTKRFAWWKNPANPLMNADDAEAEAWEDWVLSFPKVPKYWPNYPNIPLFYSAGSGSSTADNLYQIGQGNSTDGGFSFARLLGQNPVFPKAGVATSFYNDSVLEFDTTVWNGAIHAVFSGQNTTGSGGFADGKVRLGYAVSTDGLVGRAWNANSTPILDVGGSFDSEQTAKACVLRFSDTDWRMWYSAKPGPGNDDWFTVAYATASSITGPWTKQGVVLSKPGLFLIYPYVVQELDGTLTLYLQEGLNQTGGPYDLQSYRSVDGINWVYWRPAIARSPHIAYDDVYLGGGHSVQDFPSGPGGSMQRHLWYASRISTDGDETGTYPFIRRYRFVNHAIIQIPYFGGFPKAA